MEKRQEIINHFVEIGKEVFSNVEKYNFPKENVMMWLWSQSEEEKTILSDLEKRHIIAEVHAHANNIFYRPNHQDYLNVADLKKKLEKIPDNVPIYYQTVNDDFCQRNPQCVEKLVGETHKIKEEDIHYYENNKNVNIIRKNGEVFVQDLFDHVAAFTGYLSTDKEGKKVFILTAFY